MEQLVVISTREQEWLKHLPQNCEDVREVNTTVKHEIVSCRLPTFSAEAEFIFIRPIADPPVDFLLQKVSLNGKDIWQKDEELLNQAKAKVVCLGQGRAVEYFIILFDQRKLYNVIPLAHLKQSRLLKMAGSDQLYRHYFNLTPDRLIQIKKDMAKQLQFLAEYSQFELKLVEVKTNHIMKKRNEEKTLKLQSLGKRSAITAFTDSNEKRWGIPIGMSEEFYGQPLWHLLEDETYVILVKSYDEVSEQAEGPIESFSVNKSSPTRIGKSRAKPVVSFIPIVQAVTFNGLLYLDINGQPQPVPHFDTDDFKQLRADGITGDAVYALGKPDAYGRYTVVKISNDECQTLGQYATVE